jgi:diguanylate cyclase (GGDEF)-like protein/PAS domain S-box-containing protein
MPLTQHKDISLVDHSEQIYLEIATEIQLMRILVIDDDAMTRLLIQETLAPHGYEVIEADNGVAGIALALEHTPDLVLLDVVMPGMDGFTCLEILRENMLHSCKSVPIVMLTGVEDSDSIERVFAMGASDFIHKPIIWPLLVHRLRFVINSHLQNSQLRISEERLRLSMRGARQGFYDIDVPTGRTVINDEYATMLGYDPRTFEETNAAWLERLHPDDRQTMEKTYLSYIAGEQLEYRGEFRIACADGAWKWILSIGSIVERDSAGKPLRMLGTHTDIDHLKQNEERLRLLANVFENSGEGILVCSASNKIIEVNQSFTHITGYDANEVIGKDPQFLIPDLHSTIFYESMRQSLNETGYWQGDVWSQRKDGESFPTWLSISTVLDGRDKLTHYIMIFSDITERKAAVAQIEYLAHHDALTHLPNRTLLRDRFEQAVAHSIRNNSLVATLFLDLDRFKQINDTLGHDVGDRLLQGISTSLVKCLREVDSICRQGGDEFIIVLTDLRDTDAVVQIVQKILHQLNEPFDIDGIQITTSFSIGISIYPVDGVNFDGLLNKADTAMYTAKKQGRNTFRFFSSDMNIASMERMIMENDLRYAFENGELSLHYQPQYSTKGRQLKGAEALLRWTKATGERVPPAKFIPVAEDIGLIVPIGEWVLHEACRQNRLWHDTGLTLTINVNVSAVQFKQGNLVESVRSALASSGLDPRYLELEFTESTLMVDVELVGKVMLELRELGVTFAIDDFGSGYSSLNRIKRFAVDKLKIAPSFVSDLSHGRQEDKMMIQAIVQLGQTLGIKVLAEGVETQDQFDQLVQLGCENVQGFFLSHPLSVVDFERVVLATLGVQNSK